MMKKIFALILMLCVVLAASAALADTDTFILYYFENPEGETFTAEDTEDFPFYAFSFDSDLVTVVLYKDGQDPLSGTYALTETDDDNVLLATLSFENGEQLEIYAVTSDRYLMWVDDDNWTNVMISLRDHPNRDAVQLKLDRAMGLTTYVLTSVTTADGQVLSAENGDDVPNFSLSFCKDPTICISRVDYSEREFEYSAEADKDADILEVTVTGPEGQTITLTGTYSGNTLTMENPSTGEVYTLTMAN